ncbi:MAG: peptide chain release factor N(5)-glutamine methyltransferase [Patescibacteria group bacterium]|mgnify:FL=1
MALSQREIDLLLREKYKGRKTRAFRVDLKRLTLGEPLDYVIGWREFLGVKIDLKFRPLIPRAETEFWVEPAIGAIKDRTAELGRPVAILDLFAGSGCVGLAVLKHCLDATVVLADRDLTSLKQLRRNLKLNQPSKRVKVIESDIFSGLSNQYFDFILANPPYVPTFGRGSKIQKSVKNYEPAEALFAGPDGLKIIRRFFQQAKAHLKPGGQIWLEFGVGQKSALVKLIRQGAYSNFNFQRDQFGRWRFVVISL